MRDRRPLLLGAFLLLCLLTAVPAGAAEPGGGVVEGLLARLELGELEAFTREVGEEVRPYLPEMSLRQILANLQAGKPVLDPLSLPAALGRIFWGEVLANAKVMGQLLILAVLAAVLYNLQAAFERRTVGELAHLVVLLALVVLAVGSFSVAMQTAREAVDRMSSFMQALLPVLLTLMTAMGGLASAAVLHPLVLGSLALGGTLVKDVVLPLLYFAAVLNIVGRLSERFPISRLADLFKTLSGVSLGLFVTLAVGILAVHGVAAGAADSLTLRTAKFASTAFVPVIGKTLTDAVEAVAGASLLVKNAVGLLGLLVLMGIALFPAVKIAVLALIYHLTAALVQPFGDARISDTLQAMGGTLGLAFAAVVAVALFFFLALAVVVGVGSLTALW
ncbi:MAG: stage III sporulation protein AE [Clostridia bacterium]|nr:stage III sporulation protein AE [Clostridia bacterium]